MQSQIEDIFMCIENNKINVSYEDYKEEKNNLEKCEKLLMERIKDDKQLWQLIDDYNSANEIYNCAVNIKHYKEGFICGARVALEISGWKVKKE